MVRSTKENFGMIDLQAVFKSTGQEKFIKIEAIHEE